MSETPEIFMIWSSKYALTNGIMESRATLWTSYDGVEYYNPERDEPLDGLQSKSSTFRNRADAVTDAIKRRDKKIASLKKQVAVLEKLTFAPPPPNQFCRRPKC